MKTVRRLFYLDIVSAVVFVALAFLSLFFFIDFVDELGDVGKRGYTALDAAAYSLLEIPGHLYELAPIAVLIGTIYALARMAQSSEFTILRTGGLGPGRALSLLAGLGLIFAVFTFVIGDYVAPYAEQQAEELRSGFSGGRAGAWLKDRQVSTDGEHNVAVNVASAGSGNQLEGIRIYEFGGDGSLVKRIAAESGTVDRNGRWALRDVEMTRWSGFDATAPVQQPPRIESSKLEAMDWSSGLSADVVAAAVLPLATMSTWELWRYIGHLSANDQAAQRQEIQFWKRAFYPFACIVMVALALPFAYLHARAGGISLKIFGGIMLGISFVLLNNVAGHLGLLRNWTPWLTALVPSGLYLLLSLGAFAWLVRYR
ncbi:LPS export ABC transporter permease LptG [Piscinibacter sakaiensis]|uniref:LPS export ABC transporter permease LptG n=1 Tax=Piscinibacter sakaiensis TaxID=1547922 RepID=UPI003AAD2634